MATITPVDPNAVTSLAKHNILGWPRKGTCHCGAQAALLGGSLDKATYECRGTPTDPSKSVYGDDRCGDVFDVKRET